VRSLQDAQDMYKVYGDDRWNGMLRLLS